MKIFIYNIFIFIIGFLLETIVGDYGVFIPIIAILAFHWIKKINTPTALFFIFLLSGITCAIYARNIWINFIALALVSFFSIKWHDIFNHKNIFLNFIAGIFIACLYLTPIFIEKLYIASFEINNIANIISSTIFSLILISLLNPLAGYLYYGFGAEERKRIKYKY